MKLNRHAEAEPPAPAPPASRLADVRPLSHDDDERQSGADLNYGQTIFTRPPVPMPRWLRRRKRKAH